VPFPTGGVGHEPTEWDASRMVWEGYRPAKDSQAVPRTREVGPFAYESGGDQIAWSWDLLRMKLQYRSSYGMPPGGTFCV